ncbi:hypothetical protein GCM10028821_10910 [Hymenobacter jeollabukensis]
MGSVTPSGTSWARAAGAAAKLAPPTPAASPRRQTKRRIAGGGAGGKYVVNYYFQQRPATGRTRSGCGRHIIVWWRALRRMRTFKAAFAVGRNYTPSVAVFPELNHAAARGGGLPLPGHSPPFFARL